jgi:hypothetical protein
MKRVRGSVYLMEDTVTLRPYIGSTQVPLEIRFRRHKSSARHGGNSDIYKAMREHTFTMTLLELVECDHVSELRQREDHYMALHDSINNGYNCNRAFVSAEQRVGVIRSYKRKFYKNNKAKIRQSKSKKVQCPTCGTYGWHSATSRHERTAMHARLNVD